MPTTTAFQFKQELGKSTLSGKKYGSRVRSTKESWALAENEIGDLIQMTVSVAEQELQVEQRNGSLVEYTTWVDNSQFKSVNEVKFGGKIEYNAVSGLADLMLFIHEKAYITIMKEAYDTGAMRDSITWRRNGILTDGFGVPILNKGDQLVVYLNVRYGKYQENGYRGIKGKKIMKRIAALAKARFGKGFIIEHRMLQTSQIPPSRVTKFKSRKSGKRFAYSAFTKDYYKKRWAVSYSGISITQREGVGFYV